MAIASRIAFGNRHATGLLVASMIGCMTACGTDGSTRVEGTVAGTAFTLRDGFLPSVPSPAYYATLDLLSVDGACDAARARVWSLADEYVVVTLTVFGGGAGYSRGELGAGSYAITTPYESSGTDPYASAVAVKVANGDAENLGVAVSGVVQFDLLDPKPGGGATGTVDLVFDTGDHVTGHFSVDTCDLGQRGW